MSRGRLIAIEGIDGSGKRTQMDLLAQALEARGGTLLRISFPRYESFFGKMVAGFLNGDFGQLEQVDPHFSALLYAGDRLEARGKLEEALAAGRTILADRYIASNLAHQTARVAPERRGAFLAWLKHLEYTVYALPAEDLVIYLRVPAAEAQRLVGQKNAREYTRQKRDLQEADLLHLEEAAAVYDQLARAPNWATIECWDTGKSAMRSPEAIHQDVLAALTREREKVTGGRS